MKWATVNSRIWVEGLILIAIGLMSAVESLRLIFYKDPHVLYDWLGPGKYLLLVSVGMVIVGVIHVHHHLGEKQFVAMGGTSKKMRLRLIGSFLTCAVYLILIDVVGYSIATFVFFILMFRIVGFRSWPYIFVLSAFLSAAYHLVFIKYCNVIFPRIFIF